MLFDAKPMEPEQTLLTPFRKLFSGSRQTGKAGRHLLLAAIRADCRKANRCHSGGQELEEDGRGRIVW